MKGLQKEDIVIIFLIFLSLLIGLQFFMTFNLYQKVMTVMAGDAPARATATATVASATPPPSPVVTTSTTPPAGSPSPPATPAVPGSELHLRDLVIGTYRILTRKPDLALTRDQKEKLLKLVPDIDEALKSLAASKRSPKVPLMEYKVSNLLTPRQLKFIQDTVDEIPPAIPSPSASTTYEPLIEALRLQLIGSSATP